MSRPGINGPSHITLARLRTLLMMPEMRHSGGMWLICEGKEAMGILGQG